MIKQNKISIIVTTFNKVKFIKKTLSSCLTQNYKNFEIIVVDTGSTDKTRDVIQKFKNKRLKKIFIKRKFNSSPLNQIYAIKKALKFAKGKIVCLLDGDDIFMRNKLKEVNNFFQKNDNIFFLQDIVKIKKKNKFLNFEIERNFVFFKIWPKFYPTSSFSIKKKSLSKFFKENKARYDFLEIDLKLFFYSKFKENNHFILNKILTIYVQDKHGISSKFKKFNFIWFSKRLQAHEYLMNLRKKEYYPFYFDYFLTSLFMKIFKLLRIN